MTVPEERTRAVLRARELLRDLTNPAATPRVPKQLRDRATSLLKHYPNELHLELAARHCPQWWGPPAERLDVLRSKPSAGQPSARLTALSSLAQDLQSMTHEELEQLILDSAPLAEQLQDVVEVLSALHTKRSPGEH